MISGTLFMGHGDKIDTAAGMPLVPGAFMSMPAKTHHYAYTKKETVLQLSSMGPWGITYLNPADDPRTTAAAAAIVSDLSPAQRIRREALPRPVPGRTRVGSRSGFALASRVRRSSSTTPGVSFCAGARRRASTFDSTSRASD